MKWTLNENSCGKNKNCQIKWQPGDIAHTKKWLAQQETHE